MKPTDLSKLTLTKKSIFEKESSPTREKQFPKIEATERLEKKTKQEEDSKSESIFSPTVKSEILADILINSATALGMIEELSATCLKKIISMKEKGMLKLSFIIQTKHFDEVEVIIKLFDTNPDTYHIKILGNEKVQEATIQHQNILSAQIHRALPHIRVHILPPTLQKKNRYQANKKKKGVAKPLSSCYGA